MKITYVAETAEEKLPIFNSELLGAISVKRHKKVSAYSRKTLKNCYHAEPFYKLIRISNPDADSLSRESGFIFGGNADVIREQLEAMFPSDIPNGTRVQEIRNSSTWDRLKNKTVYYSGFTIFDWPVVTDIDDEADLITMLMTVRHPVLIDDGDLSDLTLDDNFTQRPFAGNLICVNFNPGIHRRREYNNQKRMWKESTRDTFTPELLYSTYHLLSPANWSSDHPFAGLGIRGHTNNTRSNGWGSSDYRREEDYTVDDILGLIKFNQKLEKNFRTKNHEGYSWTTALTNLCVYLRAVESDAKNAQLELVTLAKRDYSQKLQSMFHSWHWKQDQRLPKFSIFLKSKYADHDETKILKLCRWYRQQIRAAQLTVARTKSKPLTANELKRKQNKKGKND